MTITLGLAGALAISTGCALLSPATPPGQSKLQLPPVLQRMRDTYPDLASGRFVSLADFESQGQELLFRCAGLDGVTVGRPQPTLSILRSRNETGGMGLKVRIEDPQDQLLLDAKRTSDLTLLRDWRPYALLLMSIYGPPQGTLLEFKLQSGQGTPLYWTRTLWVGPGWNLIRLDLGTAGEWINLADVRALAWRIPDLAAPVELYLDDIIVADNAQYVLNEHAGPGELYALTRGRRIIVGVRERFELAFADGQLVGWRSGNDENLVDPDGLGPWPVPLPADWFGPEAPAIAYDDPQLFSGWGSAVTTTQRMIEATPFRAVILGQWEFHGPYAETATLPSAKDLPSHSWRYVIYPWGALYVSVVSRAPDTGWSRPRVGYALALDGRRGFVQALAPPRVSDSGFVLLARPGGQRSDLLWSWPRSTPLAHQRVLASHDERRLAIISGDLEATPIVQTAHLLRIWPTDIDAAPEAASFAADYRQPAALAVTTGTVVTEAPGDFDADDYNESEGLYELLPDSGRVRFTFSTGTGLRYDPAFRVHDVGRRRCWVYARGRLLKDVGYDLADDLLFRLAEVVSAPVDVEVHVALQGEP